MPDKVNMLGTIILYLIGVNIIGYGLMWYDKRCAQNHQWRIKERTLLSTALIGGSIGSLIGMYQFRHKTKHPSFTIGIPAMLILQLSLLIIYKFNLQDEIINALKSWI